MAQDNNCFQRQAIILFGLHMFIALTHMFPYNWHIVGISSLPVVAGEIGWHCNSLSTIFVGIMNLWLTIELILIVGCPSDTDHHCLLTIFAVYE